MDSPFSFLPRELLGTILDALPLITRFAVAARVCTAWHSQVLLGPKSLRVTQDGRFNTHATSVSGATRALERWAILDEFSWMSEAFSTEDQLRMHKLLKGRTHQIRKFTLLFPTWRSPEPFIGLTGLTALEFSPCYLAEHVLISNNAKTLRSLKVLLTTSLDSDHGKSIVEAIGKLEHLESLVFENYVGRDIDVSFLFQPSLMNSLKRLSFFSLNMFERGRAIERLANGRVFPNLEAFETKFRGMRSISNLLAFLRAQPKLKSISTGDVGVEPPLLLLLLEAFPDKVTKITLPTSLKSDEEELSLGLFDDLPDDSPENTQRLLAILPSCPQLTTTGLDYAFDFIDPPQLNFLKKLWLPVVTVMAKRLTHLSVTAEGLKLLLEANIFPNLVRLEHLLIRHRGIIVDLLPLLPNPAALRSLIIRYDQVRPDIPELLALLTAYLKASPSLREITIKGGRYLLKGIEAQSFEASFVGFLTAHRLHPSFASLRWDITAITPDGFSRLLAALRAANVHHWLTLHLAS